MAPYSEIYTPAEEDKTNNVIDSGDSSDEDTQIETVEGHLDWPSMVELADDSEDADMLQPSISAVRHSMSFLSTVVDRSATTLATTILA